MTTFDEREKGFEAKFRLDEETAFKVNVRRVKLIGLWVARELGLQGADADAYARTVVEADFAEPGESDVIKKILADVAGKGTAIDEATLKKEMDRLLILAKDQILAEAAAGKK